MGLRARVSFALRGASKILRCSIGSWTTCVRALSWSPSSPSALPGAPSIIISIMLFPSNVIIIMIIATWHHHLKLSIVIMFFFFTISATVAYTIIVIMLKVIESVSSCPRTAFILTVLLLILMIIEHVIGTKRMVDLHNHKASVASSAATTMTARFRTLVNCKDNSKQHVESSHIAFSV